MQSRRNFCVLALSGTGYILISDNNTEIFIEFMLQWTLSKKGLCGYGIWFIRIISGDDGCQRWALDLFASSYTDFVSHSVRPLP